MSSSVLLVLDVREPAKPSMELTSVLGTELLWGDCASPAKRAGVFAADVSIGGGSAWLFWT